MSFSDNFYKELEKQKKKKKDTDNDIAPVSTGDSFSDNFYAELRKREKEIDGLALNRTQDVVSFSQQEHDDDIAPVKGGNKNSVFKSGGFSDGVDGVGDFFVDLGQTVLGSVGDLGLNLVKGAGRLVEGVTDLATYGVAGVADLFGADDFADKTKNFAKKSQTDALSQWAEDYVDQYSVFGDKADMVGEGLGQVAGIILTGGAGSAAGLSAAGVSALTTGTMFASGMGSGMSEAYEMGASDGSAVAYGAMTGAVEAVSEMIFGGLGKGVQALGLSKGLTSIDDVFAKKLSNAAAKYITSEAGQKVVGNALEYAVKSGAEGLEEVISGCGSALAKDLFLLNGEDEKRYKEILKDENLLEQFVVGSITSAIAQSGYIPGMQQGSLREANKAGKDFVSGLSKNEQTVVDKVFEERLAEESKTRKISNTEKNKLYDQVVEEMKRGYIDTDTIERILGGKTYEGYKNLTEQETSLTDRKKAIEDEIKEFRKTTTMPMTLEQHETYAAMRNEAKAIKEQLKGLDTKTAKSNLFNEVNKLTANDTFLRESYNQREKRGQAFTADLSKYKGKQREAVKRAIDSGVLNDTYRSHELVDVLSRLEAEKGIVFDYTNNKKLAQSGMTLKGKTINGFEKDGVVTLNVQSSKAWQSTVGHEITHVLEGTEAYSALQQALVGYAKSKGDYQGRYDSLVELYKGVKGYETDFEAKIQKELTADLVGDYLFSDKAFIDRLVGNRTLFQKVWDEVKYLCKVATGKELTEIEKVNREFERAWKELGQDATESGSGEILLSVSKDIANSDSSWYNEIRLPAAEQERVQSEALTWNAGRRNQLITQTLSNEVTYRYTIDDDGIVHVYEREQSVNIHDWKDNYGNTNATRSDSITEELWIGYGNNSIDSSLSQDGRKPEKDDSNDHLFVSGDGRSNGTGYSKNRANAYGRPKKRSWHFNEDGSTDVTYSDGTQTKEDIAPKKEVSSTDDAFFDGENTKTRLSLSKSVEETDADYMSAVESGDTETAQLMVDDAAKNAGYSVKAYHGTGRADRVGNVFRTDRATSGPMAFFTDSKDIASNYARDKADTSLAYDEEYDSYYTQFRVNRNGKSISIPELWKYLSVSERNRIKEQAGHIKFDDDYETIIVDESAQHGNGAWDAYTLNSHRGNALEALIDTWLESGDLYNQEELFLEVLKNVGLTGVEYRNPDARYEKVYDTWLKITNPFDTDNADQSFYDGLSEWIDNNDMSVYEKETANADMWDKNNQTPESWLGKLEYDIESGTTHAWTVIPDFVTDYLKSQGFDGIKDKGGKGGGDGHTVWIPFSSERVKSAEAITRDDNGNVIPLSQRFDPSKTDIRNSLSNEGEEFAPTGNYSTPLRETALEGDIAPVQETVEKVQESAISPTENVQEMLPTEKIVAPKSERIASGERSDELLYESLDNYPMQTVEQKIAEKVRALQGEIADKKDLRRDSWENYETQIANLRAKYNSKKNKNTKEASKILESISRLERLKASREAELAKSISDLEARVERMSDPKYSRAMQKQAKMESDAKWAEDLIGDTSTWVDKKIGLQYATNTERRNLRDIVRDENGNADIAKADAIDDALNGQYNRDEAAKKRELAQVRGKYADLKITKAEDAYIQMLGEFRNNPDTTLTEQDVKEYYEKHKSKIDTEKVDKVIELARQDYDNFLTRVNAELKKQGMKEIPYRQGYFPHFTEPKQNFIQKLLNWKTQDNEIPTSIAGLTETFKPTKSWQSFDKTRHSDETDYSFMKGFDSYSEGALDWIYHMDTLQKRRAVENHIRFTHSDEGIQARIKEVYADKELDANEAQAQIEHILTEAKNPLNNFVQDFTTHTNILAGKKNSLDRTVEQWTNRHIYSVMTNVQNRMSANMVLANVRSALTNFIPITQSWAQVSPIRSLQAAKDTIANSIKDDGTIDKSAFLTNRLREVDRLYQTNWDKVLDKAGIMFEIVDNFSSQVIWRSKYNQNLAEGMSESEAIKNADQFAENVMAGRSKGNEPTLFNAKNPFVKAFTMFQLEVNNQYGYLFKDVPNDLKAETEHWKFNLAKGYTTAFIGAYVYNALLEKVTGSDAALDPIGIVVELLRDLGLFDDDEEKETEEALENLKDNILKQTPFLGGYLGGGRLPISTALPIRELVTGKDSYGNEKSRLETMAEALPYTLFPLGYGQIKKTYQGLNMFSDEHPVSGSYTDGGNLRFPVEDTPLNRAQAAIFGQYASENAREYFDNGYAPLKEKQIQEYIDVDIPIKDYWEYREGLNDLAPLPGNSSVTLEQKVDYINSLDLPVSKKNILVNNITDRKDPIDMTDYGDYSSLEEFDFANKYPDKYAVAKSVGGYSSYKTYAEALGDIKADKDANGKTITGSRKEKVIQYINGLNADYETKIILYKAEYPSDDTYNADIINYVNNRSDLTYGERVAILTELGFRVVNGNIYAD